MKKEPFIPGCYYVVKNSGNNSETLFLEERNYCYFLALLEKHVGKVATLQAFRLFKNKFELLLKIKDISEIPAKYRERIHQPFADFFSAYSHSINKAYGRSGSLFREHFKRFRIESQYVGFVKSRMEETPITKYNLPIHEVSYRLRSIAKHQLRTQKNDQKNLKTPFLTN